MYRQLNKVNRPSTPRPHNVKDKAVDRLNELEKEIEIVKEEKLRLEMEKKDLDASLKDYMAMVATERLDFEHLEEMLDASIDLNKQEEDRIAELNNRTKTLALKLKEKDERDIEKTFNRFTETRRKPVSRKAVVEAPIVEVPKVMAPPSSIVRRTMSSTVNKRPSVKRVNSNDSMRKPYLQRKLPLSPIMEKRITKKK